MASLVLLVSELLKHPNTDLAYSTSLPLSSCGATTSTGAPCFTEKRVAKQPATTPADRCNKGDNFGQDLSELRVCVDLVWP